MPLEIENQESVSIKQVKKRVLGQRGPSKKPVTIKQIQAAIKKAQAAEKKKKEQEPKIGGMILHILILWQKRE